MSNPLDPSMHPATALPTPTGGEFSGEPSPYSPMAAPQNQLGYDNQAG